MTTPMPTRRGFTAAILAAPALLAGPGRGRAAEGWAPSRPIRIVVPFTPGQANDIFARLLAEKASELRWPQQRVVVENRAGAGGTIGMQAVAQAAPDGHTLVFGSLATFAINPAIMANLPYDPERDFLPVTRIFEGPLLVVVPARGPDRDLAGLAARLRTGGLTYASSGPGTTQHLSTELFLQGIGARATHVPYRGSGPAMTDVAGGAVDFAFESAAAAQPLVASGMLRALAVSSARPTPGLDLPTVAEAASLPGYAVNGSGGVLAPARTPAATIAALHEGFAAAMADATVRARVTEAGTIPLAEGPEAFGRFIRDERRKWAEVARRGAIRIE
ncbi:tripartite tricarboxylate transporter substrate binding protein [Roseomonas hellenica]|uniref:Tripartite tricarboxylate transporter substrate binding protein n=1 Tax=Plastoroseomonas hellenica TaxID=2687306 RepID=A0ABS5EXD4_9PROT|nr:tripartite tricarboxylate transporter substrate-binding protein [Plastoroseomonas hellenica]MBR0664962.1 tripartite tricarboxylate transporter substrate binding protein [Plastoroseomonas hellenica]